MAGPRKTDDPLNIEGSGYGYGDRVMVNDDNRDVHGRVEAIHTNGKKIDVRIDHPKHTNHGRVVTFAPNEVTPYKEKGSKAAATE